MCENKKKHPSTFDDYNCLMLVENSSMTEKFTHVSNGSMALGACWITTKSKNLCINIVACTSFGEPRKEYSLNNVLALVKEDSA